MTERQKQDRQEQLFRVMRDDLAELLDDPETVRLVWDSCFQHSPIGIALVGEGGEFFLVNPSFAKISGHTVGELEKKRFTDITIGNDVLPDLEMYRRMIDGTIDSYHMSKTYQSRRLEERAIELTTFAVRRDGQFLFAMSFVTATSQNTKNSVVSLDMDELVAGLRKHWKTILAVLTAAVAFLTGTRLIPPNVPDPQQQPQRPQQLPGGDE